MLMGAHKAGEKIIHRRPKCRLHSAGVTPSVACGLGRASSPTTPASPPRRKGACYGGRSAFGSEGTVSLRSRTTAVLRGFRGRLARPQETAPEGEDAGMGPATTLGSERD